MENLPNIQKSNQLDSVNNDSESKETLNKEIVTLSIEGKNYEVIKSHFNYPEDIQKENGGVEGYDRFKLSWDQFDKEKLDLLDKEIQDYGKWDEHKKSLYKENEELQEKIKSQLDKISTKLGIGTEMQSETINHSVNGAGSGGRLDWKDNRFFLNKPYDIKDFFSYCEENGTKPYGDTNWSILKDGQKVDFYEYIKEYSPEYAKQYENRKSIISSERIFQLKDLNYSKTLEFLQDKDLVTNRMSFGYGSHLNSNSSEFQKGYKQPWFNFNFRNKAFAEYIENIEKYKEENKLEMSIRLKKDPNFHPQFPLVFTKDFPSFRWCFADTAYVPMKEGPNFFKFYSKEK
jgi:hypothetical protein